MFNFEEGKVDFNSVEEVKEFLTSTDDLNVLGAICFTGKDGNVEHEVPITLLIEQVGIDKTAELLFNITKESQPELMAISREEATELFLKAERGEELTEEEVRKLNIISAATDMHKSKADQRRESLFNGFTMTLVQSNDMPLFSTVGGVNALMSTYLECALITSDEKLRRAFSNNATAEDVSKLATDKIHIDEDLSPEMAILGLLHKIGELSTSCKELREKPLNFEAIVDVLDLDSEWIFEPDRRIEKSLDHLEEIMNRFSNGSNNEDEEDYETEEVSDENENGSNAGKVTDIRDRLRRK